MKFFIDTANLDEIKEASSWGLVDGVTTNPSLVSKENISFHDLISQICHLVDGPVSAEVVGTIYQDMYREAHILADIHTNVVVKIPLIPEGLKTVKLLTKEGIKTNVTLCFSATQALLAAKAGATYISPFVGRLDDISANGMDLIRDIRLIYNNYQYQTQILTASARGPLHILEAAKIGSDVVTMPFKVMMQLAKHPLTDIGLEKFLSDWRKTQENQPA
ncbi:MAG: fructose-6-phosphate aldolase [Candidatus Omnitrophica bacterium CG11_big_fil_rev_8_21_14_0_20_45_26]|uniref:Probable transaldolase n=1 Tax=Candidatus Abzuiibacterium crystallinum TaxID=1974748 RepID=A0A2H0LLU9_9BACT|nr:MAG: fructose-6-phosphate aldolase [Candidatus Omnitrophica bacterium CG11_big_fil_rev_8_21_14_0_20_45_26]PIW63239.1 MAG: fructose-6-phosphate aldolase [Candidatus Omnitrophica bacterium CG12_big_fil_rev_8_21_14_0_65_45_16]